MSEKCELTWCKSGKDGTVDVNEIIGDGAWRTMICEDCAKALDMKKYGDLPEAPIVKERLKKYYG